LIAAVAALLAAGCDRPAAAGGRSPANTPAAGMKIDSILPPGEALRRFQAALTPVTELEAAPGERDALVSKFIEALERADTAALEKLMLSKAEYGFLYFPTSVYNRKPYELAPDIAWLLNEQNGQKGAKRLLRRLGGHALKFGGYTCGSPVSEQENVFWRGCEVTYVDPTSSRPVTRRLFGTIMERGDRYKFLSYVNDF
jgi:hypothetical protein